MWMRLLGITALITAFSSCTSSGSEPTTPLYESLAGFGRPDTCSSREAQSYFDQGLTLYYAFNHEGAIASFAQAAALEPDCAMAYWGQALAAGPNINNMEMDEAASKLAFEALGEARKHLASASGVEQALIGALETRYSWPPPKDRAALNEAYASSMRRVWKEYPDDADVGALFAESLMDLRPWDLWTADGHHRPETLEVIAALEQVLELVPDHPGVNHFLIHTMEASPEPEFAIRSADVLRDRIPGAGHLVHMPSHIYIRVGRYGDAMLANQKAILADQPWIERGGFYSLYRAHNYHFLAYAAMFCGARAIAVQAAKDLVANVPLELVQTYPDFLDAFIAIPYHVMVRFGLWDEILAEPEPPSDLEVTKATWHYARTVAFAATGRVEEATKELESLRQAYGSVPESRLVGNNSACVVLEIGLPMAEGELEYRRGHFERAFELLREAVRRDDGLRYDEPWGWMMPMRHSLGALLLEQGHIEEAESVYHEDLQLHPGNGWALHGLTECLHRSGRHAEAAQTDEAFRAAWKNSDIDIKGSCFCRAGSPEPES